MSLHRPIPDIKPDQTLKDFALMLYEEQYGPKYLCVREAERQDIQRSIPKCETIDDIKAVLTRIMGRKVGESL